MIAALARLMRIVFRERPVELRPGFRYSATLGLAEVRPGMNELDVQNWLMTMGLTPTGKPGSWKADERHLSRIPKASILRAQKL